MRAPLGAAAAGLALLCAKIALADAPGDLEARLQVDDGQCFHAATLARSIEQWTKAPADPRIEVRVRRSDRGISFTLVRGDTVLGERTLEVPQAACDGMTDAVAVAIAIALDANRQEDAEPAPQNVPPAESMFQAHPEEDAQGAEDVESVPAPYVVTMPRASLPAALAIFGVDDEALYLALPTDGEPYNLSLEGPITRVLKTNGSATTVVADDCGATAYGVHDTHVYWTHGSKVVRAPKTGGPAELVFDLGDANTTLLSIAFDACNVYVNTQAAHSVSSSIWGAPLPQGSPTNADDASALACDEECDTDASTADADER
jgi:hypothetical protein